MVTIDSTSRDRPVLVVGAGIAGVACARQIADAGFSVRVLDRGRRIGGRMAVRTVDERPVDLGASYFTVRDGSFAAVVDTWRHRGLATVWTDRFSTADADGLNGVKPGPERWSAPRGLRSLVEDLATGLTVEQHDAQTVGAGPTVDGEAAAYVVLAMPDPQARRLLGDAHATTWATADHTWKPSLALAARWPSRDWPDLDGVFVDDVGSVAWIADDGRRRGDGAPVLVAHATPSFASTHLGEPDAAGPAMISDVRRLLEIETDPTWSFVQRWTYAQPTGTRTDPYHLGETGVGLCGDGWSEHPRVEAAYLSGAALGATIVGLLEA